MRFGITKVWLRRKMLEVGRVPMLSQSDLDTMQSRYMTRVGVEAARVGDLRVKIRDLQDYLVELSSDLEAKS